MVKSVGNGNKPGTGIKPGTGMKPGTEMEPGTGMNPGTGIYLDKVTQTQEIQNPWKIVIVACVNLHILQFKVAKNVVLETVD